MTGGEDGNLVVNHEQAKVIKKIYRLFLQGYSPFGIAKELISEGILTPSGKKKWSARTVAAILSNEKYKGDALLQKSFTVDFLTKEKKKNEGEIPQYYVTGNHEAIIPPSTFDRVQRLLEQRKPVRIEFQALAFTQVRLNAGIVDLGMVRKHGTQLASTVRRYGSAIISLKKNVPLHI